MTTSAPDILVEITERRRRSLAGELSAPSGSAGGALCTSADNRFLAALEAQRGNAVVAEVKMGSPKLGDLTGSYDPLEQALAYAENGAAALSVVVEPELFFGSYELLARCREASGLPTIAKDFVVSTTQLDRARDAGADAFLLIAALLEPETLRAYAAEARRRGLVPLVETHDREEIARLGRHEWELVGVNNRDLRTFDVDLGRSIELRPHLPEGALCVAESGIRSREDVERLATGGFDAFLIGETLVRAQRPDGALRSLLGRGPAR